MQVENKAIGINYIDTYVRSGLYPAPSLPSGIGTEAAGVVLKIGSGVTAIKPGDRVVYAQAPLGPTAKFTMYIRIKSRYCRTPFPSSRRRRRFKRADSALPAASDL